MDDGRVPAFGDLLRRYRIAAGLTQEELAERAGVSPRAIGDIERAVSRAPHKDTVRLLAEALGLVGDERAAFVANARRRAARSPVPALAKPHSLAGNVTGFASSPAPSFVGRARELALVEQHLADDGPSILVLAGEPGLGKTRLLAEASHRANSRGWLVLEGGCQRRGSQEPFAPLLGALTRFLHRRTPTELRADLVGCAWLVRLLPELADTIGEVLPTWTLPAEQERRLMFAAVARLLANAARREVRAADVGIMLILDDLQWVGSDALDLLVALVRSDAPTARPGDHRPLRVVGAYRDTELQAHDRLAVTLADWAHAGLVTHRALPPLTLAESGRLLDDALAGATPPGASESGHAALRARVLQRAGGLPFFVVSYAQAVRRGEVRGELSDVPWDVAQGIRQRVAALPEAARAVLATAAVIGRESTSALLVAVVARPEEEILTGLEAACQARLLIDAEQAYRFAHDLVREVVEADIGSARRTVLHRRIAAAIEALHAGRLTDHYESLAEHHLRGGAWESALRYLVLAGEKAVGAGAVHEALNAYDEALTICARLGGSAEATAVTIAEKRAFVCFDSADFPGAVADFARMGAVASQLGDRRREGLALAYGGMAAYYGHDFAAAEALLRAALALAGAELDDVRLFAGIQLSSQYMVTDRHAEARPLLRTIDDLAERVDDPLSRSWWAITGSEVLHWSGRYDEALALLDRWQGAVTTSNQLLPLLWAKWEAALAHGGKGEYARALTLLDEVVAICVSTGETFIRARALNTVGWIHGEVQDHARALELNEQSLDLVGVIETADTEISSNARLNLGDSLLALDRLDEAEAQFKAVERIVRDPRPQDQWMLWRYAQHLCHSYGELWLERGDTARAMAYADDCLQRAEASNSPKNVVKARRLLGQVNLARGDFATAEAHIAHALSRAGHLGNPPQRWKTLVVAGDLRQALGDREAAARAYAEALEIVEEVASRVPDTLRQTFLASPHIRQLRRRGNALARLTRARRNLITGVTSVG